MIDVICLENLTIVKVGDFYGVASSWSVEEKRRFGVAAPQGLQDLFAS